MAMKLKVQLAPDFFGITAPDGTESEAVEYGELATVKDRLGTLWGAYAYGQDDDAPSTYKLIETPSEVECLAENFPDPDTGLPLTPDDGGEDLAVDVEEGEEEEEEIEEGVEDEDAATADDSEDGDEDDEDDAA